MTPATAACLAFEQDIHLFLDRELADEPSRRLVGHMDGCDSCSSYLNDLRDLAQVHRDSARTDEAEREAVAAVTDRHTLFGNITRRLLADHRTELARLLYELGKAYVLLANRELGGPNHRSVLTVSEPRDIRQSGERGRAVATAGEALARNPLRPDPELAASGSLFSRSRRLFRSSARAGAGALTNGRRLLAAALAVEPGLEPARLYLGFAHFIDGRHDRARLEFRRVYRDGCDPVHRMMALQFLGNLHAAGGDLSRAVECYEEVVASGLVEREPRLFTSLVNLAVNCAKLGQVARCVQHFSELVVRFPAQVEQTRALLSRKEAFAETLRRRADLHELLRRQVPTLFAA